MLDFTSALYLGFRHPSASLEPWDRLTTGVPAALAPPPGARGIARALAALQGCEAGTLATSTLHLFWDLFPLLCRDEVAVYVDAESYPVAEWGLERVDVPKRRFPHHDAAALARLARRGRKPLIVTDGFCPDCGRTAPLRRYVHLARRLGGRVVVDDTQALGILGSSPGPHAPYGRGGGGSLRWHGLAAPELVVAASLAKGFGAPLAALSGPRDVVESFETDSGTRVHSSPPNAAALAAAARALTLNRTCGNDLRRRLAHLVRLFRQRLAEAGVGASGGLFPVQTLATPGLDAAALHDRLLAQNVKTVLRRSTAGEALVTFVITARHRPAEVVAAVGALRRATSGAGGQRRERVAR